MTTATPARSPRSRHPGRVRRPSCTRPLFGSSGRRNQAGIVSGSAFSGDTDLRLFNDSTEVAYNDDSCGGVGSRITYTAGASGTYRIQMGCFSSGSCSGTFAYSVSALLTQAQMLPSGFTSADTSLQASPSSDPADDAIIDVTEGDALRKLVDSELQVVVGSTLHHITNIGLAR